MRNFERVVNINEFEWKPFNAYATGPDRSPREGRIMLFKMSTGYFFLGARSGGMVIPVSAHNRPIPMAQIIAFATKDKRIY